MRLVYILNIETSTKNCSVSLSGNGKLLALKEVNEGQFSHAEKLHPFIKEVIASAKISFEDLSAVAVSKGPGSYTGLRIGVSAAKGLCFALDIPLISVNTLKILAKSVDAGKNELIIPLLDARRMEVYTAVFDNELNQIRETTATIIDEHSFAEDLSKGKVYFLGDGAEKCAEVIQHENAVFVSDRFPSAKYMTDLSYKKFKRSDFEDVAYFEPFYLKDFIAGVPKKFLK